MLRRRAPLAGRLVGGRVVRVVAPPFLLQVPQDELPQSLNCRGKRKISDKEKKCFKFENGDWCGVPGRAFLSPSCRAASDTLAVFVSGCSAGKLEDSWTSSVEWLSMESD